MTPSRLLKILGAACAVLVLLWLGYLYTLIPHRKAPYAKAVASAEAIHLERGSARIDLKKSGNQWTLLGSGGTTYAVDADKLKTLRDSLKDLQLDDAISDRAERAADFDVTPDSGLRVALRAGSRTLADGLFGKQAPDFTHIYFKFPDAPAVYLARGVILGELGGVDFNGWRDRHLLTLADTQVDGILIDNAGVKTDLKRSSSTWTMNGQPIDPTPVYGLVGALAHLKADDFVDTASTSAPTYAQLTTATVTVTAGTQTVVLHIGAEDKKYQRYPAAISPQSLGWLYANKVQSLLMPPSAFPSKK